jgi:hypothetical protein
LRGRITAVEGIVMAGGFKNLSTKHSTTAPLADLRPGDILVVSQKRREQDRTLYKM